jgi:phenylacetate-CoA ligase
MNNFFELAEKQTKSMEVALPLQIEALTMSKQELARLRQQRLQKLLAYAKKHSPWYREHLAHVNPETFTEERLVEIPTINKAILMENWDKIVTNPALSLALVEKHIENMEHSNQFIYLLDRYRLLVTSGSSGFRGVFIYDWDEWTTYYLMFKRYRFYNHNRTGTLLNPLKIIVIAAVVGTNPIHSIYSLEKSYKTRNATTIHIPLTDPMTKIIAKLNETQPDVLLGSSSTIFKLTKEVEKKQLNISPKVISVYGEPFYSPVRQAIQETWQHAGIFNTFGTSEGLSASYCRANSKEMHLNDDLAIAEPIYDESNCIAKKIYLTNLFNYTLPLIRYEVLDEIEFIDRTCDCGSHFQLIAEPKSRPDFDFTYKGDIFVNHIVFSYPLLSDKNIKEYQVIQTEFGADVKVLSTSDAKLLTIKENITKKLKILGIEKPEVNIINVSEFIYPPSGKLRRFFPIKSLT